MAKYLFLALTVIASASSFAETRFEQTQPTDDPAVVLLRQIGSATVCATGYTRDDLDNQLNMLVSKVSQLIKVRQKQIQAVGGGNSMIVKLCAFLEKDTN